MRLQAGLRDQDHSRAKYGNIAIVALKSGDRSLVGGSNRVKRFA
jgi:hypothetical protein